MSAAAYYRKQIWQPASVDIKIALSTPIHL
jgi:hypothetical protein